MNGNMNMRGRPERRPQERGGRMPASKGRFPLGELLIAMLIVTAIFAVIWASAMKRSSPAGGTATGGNTTDTALPAAATETPTVDPDSYTDITLLCGGDVMYHSPQIESAYDSVSGAYDFSPSYRYVKSIVSAADYAVVNFETTLAGPDYEYTGWPAFNSPDSGLTALTSAGFDMMLFANNHCYDTGHAGVVRTQEVFRSAGVDYIGARPNTSERTYRTVNVNGTVIGMLNSTNDIAYGNTVPRTINGITIADEDLPLLDIFNDSLMEDFYSQTKNRIAELKNEGAGLIIYFIHWGDEYSLQHNAAQAAIAQRLCDLGVDVIIGGHPHVIQDAEILNSTTDPSHSTLCFYSLGNLISNQNRLTLGDTANKEYTENGLFVRLTVRRYGDGRCELNAVETIPLWVHRYYSAASGKTNYDVIPLEAAIADPSSYGLYESSFGVSNAGEAYRMTNTTLGGICEAFASKHAAAGGGT